MLLSTPQDPNRLSQQFSGNSGASIAASMSPIPPSDHGAPAAHTETAHVSPLRKGGGKMAQLSLWDNPIAGGSPVVDFSKEDSGTMPPLPLGA